MKGGVIFRSTRSTRSTMVTEHNGVVVASIGVDNETAFTEQTNLSGQGFNLEEDSAKEDVTNETNLSSPTRPQRKLSIRVPSINRRQQYPRIDPNRQLLNLRLMEQINPAFTQEGGVEVSAELTLLKQDQDEVQTVADEVKTVQASNQEEIQLAPDEVKAVPASAQYKIQPAPTQPARAQISLNSSSCCCAGILNYFFYSRRIHPDNSPEIIGANSLTLKLNHEAEVGIV